MRTHSLVLAELTELDKKLQDDVEQLVEGAAAHKEAEAEACKVSKLCLGAGAGCGSLAVANNIPVGYGILLALLLLLHRTEVVLAEPFALWVIQSHHQVCMGVVVFKIIPLHHLGVSGCVTRHTVFVHLLHSWPTSQSPCSS